MKRYCGNLPPYVGSNSILVAAKCSASPTSLTQDSISQPNNSLCLAIISQPKEHHFAVRATICSISVLVRCKLSLEIVDPGLDALAVVV